MVVCDVVPMEACHILLGRPWQYDKKAIHDGFTNKISFVHQEKKIVLKPLSPKDVSEDQVRMREKITQERKEERKVSQKESDLSKKGEVSEKKKSKESKSETLEREKRETFESLKSEIPKKKQHGTTTKREEKNVFLTKQSLYLKNVKMSFLVLILLLTLSCFLVFLVINSYCRFSRMKFQWKSHVETLNIMAKSLT